VREGAGLGRKVAILPMEKWRGGSGLGVEKGKRVATRLCVVNYHFWTTKGELKWEGGDVKGESPFGELRARKKNWSRRMAEGPWKTECKGRLFRGRFRLRKNVEWSSGGGDKVASHRRREKQANIKGGRGRIKPATLMHLTGKPPVSRKKPLRTQRLAMILERA